LQAGRIAINNANSLGADTNSVMLANGTSLETAAAVTAKQAVQVTGDVTINTLGHDSSLMGVVSGVGNVHKTNAGRLALEGMNTFTGMVDVQAGSVAINNANSLGADANSVMLANGTSLETAAAVMAKQAVQVTGDVTINTAGHDSSLMGW
jgi:fibronectin-binding autotransporter adhesin